MLVELAGQARQFAEHVEALEQASRGCAEAPLLLSQAAGYLANRRIASDILDSTWSAALATALNLNATLASTGQTPALEELRYQSHTLENHLAVLLRPIQDLRSSKRAEPGSKGGVPISGEIDQGRNYLKLEAALGTTLLSADDRVKLLQEARQLADSLNQRFSSGALGDGADKGPSHLFTPAFSRPRQYPMPGLLGGTPMAKSLPACAPA